MHTTKVLAAAGTTLLPGFSASASEPFVDYRGVEDWYKANRGDYMPRPDAPVSATLIQIPRPRPGPQ